MPEYATAVNKTTGERKKVTVGDPNAFAGGFELETRPPEQGAGDLGGTLGGGNDFQLPGASQTMNQFTSLRNLMDSMTGRLTQSRGSVSDVVSNLKSKLGGSGALNPTTAGQGIQNETARYQNDVGTIFRSIMRQIDTMESVKLTQQQNVNSLMGNLATAGLLNLITGQEYDQIMNTGVLPVETLQKISEQVATKQNEQSKPSISEQLAAIKAGYGIENGELVKDVSGATADQVAEAIKQIESGGNYDAKGGSGEFGAYQFMPDTWNQWSNEYANQVLKMSTIVEPTPENQDAVAKFKIEQWLKGGLSPEQIAAKWNSGSEYGWENKKGVNSAGVAYDVPAYVGKFKNALTNLVDSGGSLSPLAQQVLEDPSLLSTFTPTKATEIREEFAQAGLKVPQVPDMETKAQMEKGFRSDFNSVNKEAKSAIRQIKTMNTAYDEAVRDKKKMNAASQGVLVVFQKMLDPTSVVRESEYARSGTGLSLAGQIQGYLTKLKEGGAGVTIEDLKDFVDVANEYYEKIYKPSIIDEATLVKDNAEAYSLDLDLILNQEILGLLNEASKPRLQDELGNVYEYDSEQDPDYVKDLNSGFKLVQ